MQLKNLWLLRMYWEMETLIKNKLMKKNWLYNLLNCLMPKELDSKSRLLPTILSNN